MASFSFLNYYCMINHYILYLSHYLMVFFYILNYYCTINHYILYLYVCVYTHIS